MARPAPGQQHIYSPYSEPATLEGIASAARVREEMRRWQTELPGWAQELRALRELLEA